MAPPSVLASASARLAFRKSRVSPDSVDLVLACHLRVGPRACVSPGRWDLVMALFIRHPEFLSPAERLRAREPVRSDRTAFDGSWWPDSNDLDIELGVVLPLLDHVRGPVRRLVLRAGDWPAEPDRIVTDLRTVGVDYLIGQPRWTMTVVCVDGGTFTMRVVPPGPNVAAPDGAEARRDADVWEGEGGGLGRLLVRATR
ncbi:DUF5994 family protein [Actinoplanes sp. NPDC020271]|uniref:DUF5994 family protein n=1 Tax=Actinoplanes sp. NPDC020271 TaxID=3363896 RepID=UPI0037B1C719